MGAVSEGGVVVRNQEVLDIAGIPERVFAEVARRELAEVERRVAAYRGRSAPIDPTGHTAIVVDDGLATGSTMLAALHALRSRAPQKLVCAVPVAPPDTLEKVGERADEVVCLYAPENFQAVGQFYADFGQVEDDEVIALLSERKKS